MICEKEITVVIQELEGGRGMGEPRIRKLVPGQYAAYIIAGNGR